MNRAPSLPVSFDQKPINLFDDQFLSRGENNNLVSNYAQKDVNQMNERERRIYLRDKERERRSQLPPAGIGALPIQLDSQYGGGVPAVSPQQYNNGPQFGINPPQISSSLNKRDQILAMKAQQRQLSQQRSIPEQQPSNQFQAPQQNFQEAQQHFMPSQLHSLVAEQQPSSIPFGNKKQEIPQQFQQFPSDNQFEQKKIELQNELAQNQRPSDRDQDQRRINQNRQRQQEYQEHLMQQEMKKQQNRPQVDPQFQPSEQLLQGGLAQIGDHQYKQSVNKQKQQIEYKRSLEEQLQQKQNDLNTPVLTQQKKQIIAEQIFNQVIDSQRQMEPPRQLLYQPEQMYSQYPANGVKGRVQSAVGANRQLELQKLQMQQTKEMFHQSQGDEESKRRKEFDKKREYAAMLQEQMQQKKQQQISARSQVTSAPPQMVQQQPSSQYSQRQDQFNNGGAQQIAYQRSNKNLDNFYNNQPSQHQVQAARVNDYQQEQQQFRLQAEYPDYNQQQIPNSYIPNQQQNQQQQQNQNFSSKEEYRRQLEQQMKEAAEKKLKAKEEKLLYEKKYDLDTADVIQQAQIQQAAPSSGQARRLGQSDITKIPKQEDDSKVMARLKYQEELRQQVEQQKQRKEMLQKQQKIDEELEEQRLIKERQNLVGKERNEISKEGGKVSESNQPKRQVNRSQFEQSNENPNKPPLKKQNQLTNDQSRELFLNSPPVVDLYSMPSSNIPSTVLKNISGDDFAMMPPVGKPHPFNINLPPTPTLSNQQSMQQYIAASRGVSQDNNGFTVQPHPQNFSQNVFQAQQQQQNVQQTFQQFQVPPAAVDWQQQQASKMFEDQQKMIQLYQQALEQILKYRNQYFEQSMEMRENILKEREQMLEFEKLRQQQIFEMQQLQQVKKQLGSVQVQKHGLTPNLQQNLDQYIDEQKSQLLSMSQSQRKMQELMTISQVQQPQQQFTVETSRIQINAQPQKLLQQNDFDRKTSQYQNSYSDDNVFQQVDEIAEQVARITQEQQLKSMDLEIALNSNSKMVKVPLQNNLVEKAQRLQQSNLQQSPYKAPSNRAEDMLLATWNETSIENGYPIKQNNSSVNTSNNQSQILVQDVLKSQIGRSQSEIEQQKIMSPINSQNRRNSQIKDHDDAQNHQSRTIESQISRKQMQSSGNFIERKAKVTGSSFYDQTLKNQKIQAETQQAELAKQMLRIFGNTNSGTNTDLNRMQEGIDKHSVTTPSLKAVTESSLGTSAFDQQQVKPFIMETDEDLNERKEQVNQLSRNEEKFQESDINIADTLPDGQYLLQNLAKPINNQKSYSPNQNSARKEQNSVYQQSSTHKSIVYGTQSDWGNNTNNIEGSGMIPVVFNQNDEQIQQMFNYQMQETDEYGEGTVDELKQLSPSVLKTYDENSSNLRFALNQVSSELQQDQRRSIAQKLFNQDEQITDDYGQVDDNNQYFFENNQIEEEIEIVNSQNDFEQEQYQQEIQMANEMLLKNGKAKKEISTPLSKKDMEMMEIAALIRKAQATTNQAVESAGRKSQRKANSKQQQQSQNIRNFVDQSNKVQNHQESYISDEKSDYIEASQTQQNYSENALGPARNILADLDRIINNLETQKNMATFGYGANDDAQAQQNSYENYQVIPEEPLSYGNASVIDIAQHQEEQVRQPKQWKTLQEAREAARPTTSKSNKSMGKAPLAPKPITNRQQYDDNKSKISGRFADGSNHSPVGQVVGKFSQMALANQTNISDRSQDRSVVSKSPQRVGKFANMALANQTNLSDNSQERSIVSKSPQRVGQFANMALANQTNISDKSQNRSIVSRSPQRIGKFANMALVNQTNNSDKSQERSIISKSPQRVGKFAQMALGNNSDYQQQENKSFISRSPQNVGKFAQMAIGNSSTKQQQEENNRSQTSKSPQRVGKYAMMALNSSVRSKQSNDSVSPSMGLGKFAQMAINQKATKSDISQDDIDQISRKYSNERAASNVQNNNNKSILLQRQLSGAGSQIAGSPTPSQILRPVSSSQHSSRYQQQASSKYSRTIDE